MPTRDDAWNLLCEFTQNENLRKHALAVEACVRAYARKSGADEEFWGLAALLHDFDYERWPNQEHHPSEGHPSAGAKILRERGYPEEMLHAILAHADYTGVTRETPLDRALFACDEMAGFLTACSLVKPGKTIFEVETGLREAQDERQSLRTRRQPRRPRPRRSRTRRLARRPYRYLHRRPPLHRSLPRPRPQTLAPESNFLSQSS